MKKMENELMAYPPLRVTLGSNTKRFRLISHNTHKDGIQIVPGSAFKGKGEDYWHVPRTYASLVVLTNVFGDSLRLDADVQEWAVQEWENRVGPATELRNGIVDSEVVKQVIQMVPGKYTLKDYQATAAMYLATAKQAMLFDGMGTGKTFATASALFLYPETLPALVVCPKSLLYTWKHELAQVGIESVVIEGPKAKRITALENFDSDKTPVCIIPYSTLSAHSRISGYGNITLTETEKTKKELNAIDWSTVIADECHRAKSPNAQWTRALWAISENAEYKWGLTGTPIESSVLDFYYLLRWISPDEFPSRTKAQDRYIDFEIDWFGQTVIKGLRDDTRAEFEQLTEWHWRRQLLELDVDATYEYRYANLAPRELKAYKQMEKQLMAELADQSMLLADNPMVGHGRLLQLANSALNTDAAGVVTPVEPSAKLDLLQEVISDNEGLPGIIWFTHRKLLHIAEARFAKTKLKYACIHGDISSKDRFDLVEQFQNGDIDYLFIVQQSGSEGLTLTRAGISIYVELHPSSILKSQSEKRNYRLGTEEFYDTIKYVYLVMSETIEEDTADKMRIKEERAQEILKDAS